MDYIYNRFKKHVLENNLILKGDRILLSLSAGKDSMFMLDLVRIIYCKVNINRKFFSDSPDTFCNIRSGDR